MLGLRAVEDENRRLKRMFADMSMQAVTVILCTDAVDAPTQRDLPPGSSLAVM